MNYFPGSLPLRTEQTAYIYGNNLRAMPVRFTIMVTKDIIKKCKNCGIELHVAERNCAVAIALRDIFPNVYVTNCSIYPFGINFKNATEIKIPLPVIAQQFIKLFDGFSHIPQLRLSLPEFEFCVEIPDDVIEQIDIEEVRQLTYERKKHLVRTGVPARLL